MFEIMVCPEVMVCPNFLQKLTFFFLVFLEHFVFELNKIFSLSLAESEPKT